ncbi:MAG: hypothetical protein JXA21_17915 [Anaerolineae bacterium]|nr:hypothetical protein [Anaerolineae bacterium]
MPTPKFVRDNAFQLARQDLALFLEEHEAELLDIFRNEMKQLDDEFPEEDVYIDLDMVGIGDMLLKAVLRTLHRFLTETPPAVPASQEVHQSHQITHATADAVVHIPIKSHH